MLTNCPLRIAFQFSGLPNPSYVFFTKEHDRKRVGDENQHGQGRQPLICNPNTEMIVNSSPLFWRGDGVRLIILNLVREDMNQIKGDNGPLIKGILRYSMLRSTFGLCFLSSMIKE